MNIVIGLFYFKNRFVYRTSRHWQGFPHFRISSSGRRKHPDSWKFTFPLGFRFLFYVVYKFLFLFLTRYCNNHRWTTWDNRVIFLNNNSYFVLKNEKYRDLAKKVFCNPILHTLEIILSTVLIRIRRQYGRIKYIVFFPWKIR